MIETALRPGEAILAYYRTVAGCMVGLPVCNPALAVELRGWQDVGGIGGVGVLITPWCMNLFWQPLPDAKLPGKGELALLSLPSGDYECTLHEDPVLGRFASASLCSPMQDFANQAGVQAVADEVLKLVFVEPPPALEPKSAPPLNPGRRALFRRALGGAS